MEGVGYSTYTPKNEFLKSVCPQGWWEFFGAFERYLAPAYHHDRCERSVQMRLYSLSKREFVFLFFAFFISLGILTFIGLVGPPITLVVEKSGASVLNDSKLLPTGPYNLITPQLSSYNQQLWLIAKVNTESKEDESFTKLFNVEVAVWGIEKKEAFRVYDGHPTRIRRLSCKSTCDQLTLLHLPYIDHTSYILHVSFSGLETVNEKYKIKDITFYFKSYNPAYSQLELSFRFIYSVASFGMTCWALWALRRFGVPDWSMEQKWSLILLPLLFLYNNPAFPLVFLVNSTLVGLLDGVFQITFLSALLLFWLFIYHGLRQVERGWVFYLPKLLLVSSLWISAVILGSWQKLNNATDPSYNYLIDTPKYNSLKNFFMTVGILYVIYLVFLVLKAYAELRSMPYFDLRLKFLTLLLLVVVKITFLVTYLKFGADIVEDHFVAELSTTYTSSAQFMAFYGLLNLYVFAMAFVYSPSSAATLASGSSITKDNPSFSMINDSDEDVIYGSDDDDDPSRMPLKKNENIPNHNDDSD